jgi:hypothetical protein
VAPVFDEVPGLETDQPLATLGQAFVMGDQNQGGTSLLVEGEE